MRLKLFRGPSMAEALRQARAELGPDALILGARTVRGVIELTAAIEPPSPVASPTSFAQPSPVAPNTALPDIATFHGLSGLLARRLSSAPLEQTLPDLFRFQSIAPEAGPLLFVGPPGAGKTSTVARLATRLVLAGIRPMIITADGKRAGAAEQLAAYTRLLKLELVAASQPVSLACAMAKRPDGAPVLIDMAGVDCRNGAERDEVAALAAVTGARLALVLPAGLDAAEATEISTSFAEAGAELIVATRLDLTRRLGSLLHAVYASGMSFVEAGISADAANGLHPMTASLLAKRLRAGVASAPKGKGSVA